MTGFHADFHCLAKHFASALVLLSVGVWQAGPGAGRVAAQETTGSQPMRLIPRSILESPSEPSLTETGPVPLGQPGIVARPSAPPSPEEATLPTTIPSPRVGGIEVNPLAEISPEAIGVLGPSEGGLGMDMWKGTRRSVARALIARIPGDIHSPVMRDLARRLLLSAATPPEPDGAVADAGHGLLVADLGAAANPLALGAVDEMDLLTLRLDRLRAMGDVPSLNRLLEAVPARYDNQDMDRARIDGLWLAGNYDRACQLARGRISQYHAEIYWQKAMVFCQFLAGQTDQALLGLDLLREQGAADDPLFLALADLLGGGEPAALPAGDITPLHVAMILASGAPLDSTFVESADPATLFALARAPSAPSQPRAQAAEWACERGIIDGRDLGEAYDAFSFTPEELSSALSTAATMKGPAGRALLYQAARNESIPATRAEVLRVALERAIEDNRYRADVAALSPMLRELPVKPELAWLAAAAGRALYATGDFERAGTWLTLGRQEAILNPEASAAIAALWPYSRLAGGDNQTAEGDLISWSEIRTGTGNPASPHARSLLRATFQALGEQDPLDWVPLAATANPERERAMPDAAYLFALREASEAGRRGETVTLTLILLGERGPADSHVLAIEAAMTALRRVGLESEARALAIEAAIANGV